MASHACRPTTDCSGRRCASPLNRSVRRLRDEGVEDQTWNRPTGACLTILWTYHVNLRLKGRSVSRQTILDAVDSYEVVEAYPDDKYLPSYLLLARPAGDAIHVLFATDVEGDNVRVVTAYRSSPDEWEGDLKTRRPSR